MDSFVDMANGARELKVALQRGDIAVRVVETGGWTLEWSGSGEDGPQVEREGDRLTIRQRDPWMPHRRLDIQLTMPPGVGRMELTTGWGRVEAEGVHGRLQLRSGNGPLALRAASGEAEVQTGNGAIDVEEFRGTIRANTGNGSLRVVQLNGEVRLGTGNGRVEVLESDGRVEATTGNGDVVLAALSGQAEAKTGHGTIEINAARSLSAQGSTGMGAIRVEGGSVRELRLKSHMGDIHCAAVPEPGIYVLESGMGSVRMELPPTIRARVEAQTGFGQIESDFPLVRVGRSGPMSFGGGRMVGSIGEGEPQVEINLRSGKGTITVRRMMASVPPRPSTPPAPPTPPASPATPPQRDPRLEILEAVARGEISPAEAEDLLSRV